MKILIISSHYLFAKKQANIHYIYTVLKNNGCDVDWCTYPVSTSIFLRRNRDKLFSFFRGFLKQRYIFNFIPVYFFNNQILRKIFSFLIYNPKVINANYDILLSEGIAPSYIFERISYKKLVVRLSDELEYLNLLSDGQRTMNWMLHCADRVWCVLNSSVSRYARSTYLPNPSIHLTVSKELKRRKELVYVGSNKIDNELVLKIAKSGILVNIYSDSCSIAHKNIIFHGLVPKSELVKNIKQYKVGIIPFHADEKNKFMEMPLKTFDYIAAGLHVAMVTSSSEINLDFIKCVDNHDDLQMAGVC